MGPSVSVHQSLLGITTAGILGALSGLLAIKGTRTSAEGALSRSFTFSAGTGAGSESVDDACATTPMAEAGAQTEWADFRL